MLMSKDYSHVTFLPSGTSVEVPAGSNLLKVAQDAGIEVNSVCGGKGSCGKCRAKIVEGVINSLTKTEIEHLSVEELSQGVVLLCERKALGDVVIETFPVPGRREKYVPVKGDFADLNWEIDSPVSKTFHELDKPTVLDQTADLDRVLSRLPADLKVDVRLIESVPLTLREAGYSVTSVVVNNELITLEKGDTVADSYGIAIDIGTTSVAGYLVDLVEGRVILSASATNRQRTHGADVISRITYTYEDVQGLERMKQLAAQTIDEIVTKILQKSGVSPQNVYVLTFVGNTVMSHLLVGASPIGVASSPFVPAFTCSITGTVDSLGLKSLPKYTRFTLLPNVAGYVGSDTLGVILSTNLPELPGTWLAVDIGTNGEIALASGNRILTCSTAAGPAFEGACISQGMRAEPGAIYKVCIGDDVDLAVIGDVKPVGICGSGLIDAVAEMVRLGIVRTNGRIKKPEDLPDDLPDNVRNRIREGEKGWKFVLAEGEQEVALTQKDISELQLGKGAIRAGIEILLHEMGMDAANLDGILLAGAFGSNLRPENIKGIGMLPDVPLERIQAVGNAAGAGAIKALLSQKQMAVALQLPKRIEHIELSLNQSFQRNFAKAMSF